MWASVGDLALTRVTERSNVDGRDPVWSRAGLAAPSFGAIGPPKPSALGLGPHFSHAVLAERREIRTKL